MCQVLRQALGIQDKVNKIRALKEFTAWIYKQKITVCISMMSSALQTNYCGYTEDVKIL